MQDSEGFMWFGTEDGLNRFDGYEFRQLRHDRGDEQTLPNGWISSLVASEDGLWISTDGGGVVFRNAQTGKLEEPALLRDAPDLQRVRMLARDRLGRLWIASRDAGRRDLRRAQRRTRRIRHSRRPSRIRSRTIRSSAVLHLRNGDTLVGTATRTRPAVGRQSRRHAHRAAGGTESARASRVRVRALTESPDGMVWVGTDAGLGALRSAQRTLARLSAQNNSGPNAALPDNRVQALLIDSQGRLWVGHDPRVSRGSIRPAKHFPAITATTPKPVHCPTTTSSRCSRTAAARLWIGTKSGGLAKWNPRTWSFGHIRASAEEGFTDRNITSFAEDKLGRLWIGTFGSGINLLDRNTGARDAGAPRRTACAVR